MSENLQSSFDYGWCYTDHKNGKSIRTDFRKTDYMRDEKSADFIKRTLENYGLPYPNLDDELYRGTRLDLLFLDSHGVTIRMGHLNISDLVNPTILQPLHWVTDATTGITVALYPGLEIDRQVQRQRLTRNIIGHNSLAHSMERFGNSNKDHNEQNVGYLETENMRGDLKTTPIVIDVENMPLPRRANKKTFPNLAPNTLTEAFNKTYRMGTNEKYTFLDTHYLEIFEYHQPIRRAFNRAFNDGNTPDHKRLSQAWKMIKNYHDHGYKIYKKNVLVETRMLFSPWNVDIAIKDGTLTLEDIPLKHRTAQRCLAMVKRHGHNIAFVPDHLLTQALCDLAVKEWPLEVLAVPDDFQTQDMWNTAYKKALHYFPAIPKRFRNYEISLHCAKTRNHHAHLIPKNLLDNTMIKHMIDNDYASLRHVPVRKRTKEICTYAYKKSPLTILYFPKKWVSANMHDKAMEACQNTINRSSYHRIVKTEIIREKLETRFKNHTFTQSHILIDANKKKRRHKMPSPV